MMTVYVEIKDAQGAVVAVNRNDGWSIPADPANTDYQQYLKWLAEGNTPLPADPQPE
jgi:hypothetical protein